MKRSVIVGVGVVAVLGAGIYLAYKYASTAQNAAIINANNANGQAAQAANIAALGSLVTTLQQNGGVSGTLGSIFGWGGSPSNSTPDIAANDAPTG